MITNITTVKIKPGKEAEVAEICSQLSREVHAKEEGCLMYILHVSKDDPTEFVCFEKYKDEAAYKVHEQAPYTQEAGGKLQNLLENVSFKFLEQLD